MFSRTLRFSILNRPFYYEGDKGAGNGGNSSDASGEKSGANSEQNTEADKTGETDDKGGKKDGDSTDTKTGDKDDKSKGEKTFNKAEVEDIVKERLERERKKASGEYQKLYDELVPKHDLLVKENEELKSRNNTLSGGENSRIDEAIKNWPAELKDSDPGKDDVIARVQWHSKFSKLADKISGKPAPVKGENGDKGEGKGTDPATAYARRTYTGPTGIVGVGGKSDGGK